MNEALSSMHKCVLSSGRRERALLAEGSEPDAQLLKHTQQILLAFIAVLRDLALQHDDEVRRNNVQDSFLPKGKLR